MYIYRHTRSKTYHEAAKSHPYLRSHPQLLLSNIRNVTWKEKFKTTKARKRLASLTSFLPQNPEGDNFKHGQYRKRKVLFISTSYSYKMEKAVIKFGSCTSPLGTPSLTWRCFSGCHEMIDFCDSPLFVVLTCASFVTLLFFESTKGYLNIRDLEELGKTGYNLI